MFDAASGQTHAMDALTALTLMSFETAPATVEGLAAQFFDNDPTTPISQWADALVTIIGQLAANELIEPVV